MYPALIARGTVQSHRKVVHLKVEHLESLSDYLQIHSESKN